MSYAGENGGRTVAKGAMEFGPFLLSPISECYFRLPSMQSPSHQDDCSFVLLFPRKLPPRLCFPS